MGELRLIAFTDFHGNAEAYENAKHVVHTGTWDCVAVAGDIVNHDGALAKRRLMALARETVPLFFVPGNMDSRELSEWSGTGSVHSLHGRSAKVGNVFLVGLGGSPPGSFSTPFEVPEEAAARLLNQAIAGFDKRSRLVLVSHCPPKNTKLDLVPIGEHAGSMAVRGFVEKSKPALVISGHVHEAKGLDAIGKTVLVNTGPAKDGNYVDITVEGKVSVRFENFLKPQLR